MLGGEADCLLCAMRLATAAGVTWEVAVQCMLVDSACWSAAVHIASLLEGPSECGCMQMCLHASPSSPVDVRRDECTWLYIHWLHRYELLRGCTSTCCTDMNICEVVHPPVHPQHHSTDCHGAGCRPTWPHGPGTQLATAVCVLPFHPLSMPHHMGASTVPTAAC
jgi:hypothetical protein